MESAAWAVGGVIVGALAFWWLNGHKHRGHHTEAWFVLAGLIGLLGASGLRILLCAVLFPAALGHVVDKGGAPCDEAGYYLVLDGVDRAHLLISGGAAIVQAVVLMRLVSAKNPF